MTSCEHGATISILRLLVCTDLTNRESSRLQLIVKVKVRDSHPVLHTPWSGPKNFKNMY